MMRFSFVTSPNLDYASWLGAGATPKMAPYIPVGMLSLAAVIRSERHFPMLFDVNDFINVNLPCSTSIAHLYEAIAEAILSSEPDAIGFMTEYYTYHHLLRIARVIKKRRPACTVVFGGPQASACDLETLTAFREPDLIVRGEAELTMAELLEALDAGADLASVSGLTIRTPFGPQRTSSRPVVPNLDVFPIPAFDLVTIKPEDLVMIEAGRGCPFACRFCSTSDFWERNYRMKSPQRICAELTHLRDTYGVTNISLIHDCLTANRNEVLKLCDAIDAAGLRVNWGCSSRTDTIDHELIERMAHSGCHHIYFGVETGSASTQALINKNLNLETAFDMIRSARQNGVEVTTSFMVGFPGETEEAVSMTFSSVYRALSEDVYLAQIFATAPYGDTPMLVEHKENIYFTGHFLDIPMPEEDVHIRNDLMVRYKGVFSGHYRYESPVNRTLLAGADQFFPLINEMRYSSLAITLEVGDPLFLFRRWIEWTQSSNRMGGRYAHVPSYGSFESFGQLLQTLADDLTHISYLGDLLDFERTRLEVLVKSLDTPSDHYNPQLSKDLIRRHTRVQLAPNVVVKQYDHDIPAVIASLRHGITPRFTPLSGALVFRGKDYKEVRVIHLTGLLSELALHCENRPSVEDLVYRLRANSMVAGMPPDEDSIVASCLNGLEELTRQEVVKPLN
jgi:radical SAM superfamily enzyme YgiQ (UPF0313 family)